MAEFFYTDPSIGRVVNNLSRLINGDPQRELQDLQLQKTRQEMASRRAIADRYSQTTDPMSIQQGAGSLFADAFMAGDIQGLTRGNLGLAATLPGASNELLARLNVAGGGSIGPNEAFTVGRQDELDTREQQQDIEKQAATLANAIKIAGLNNASDERQNAARIFANPDSVLAQVARGGLEAGSFDPGAQAVLDAFKPLSQTQAVGRAVDRRFRGTANPAEAAAADRATGAVPKAGKPGAAKSPLGLKITEIDNVRNMVVDMLGGDTSEMAVTQDIGGVPGLTPAMLDQVVKRVDELQRQGVSATEAVLTARDEAIATGPEVGGGIFSSGRPSVIAGPGPKAPADASVGPDLDSLPTTKAAPAPVATARPPVSVVARTPQEAQAKVAKQQGLSPAEAALLPPGTKFIGLDGKPRTRK